MEILTDYPLKIIKTGLLVIGAGAAGSMAAIKASDFTKDIVVLEKAVHRSGGGSRDRPLYE